MSVDEKLGQQMEAYAKLAKENKNIDVASLMINAMEQVQREEVDSKKKSRAYAMSIMFPGVGFLYGAHFWFMSDKPDAKDVARVCMILTAASILFTILVMKLVAGSMPVGPDGRATSSVKDVKELMEMQKELLK